MIRSREKDKEKKEKKEKKDGLVSVGSPLFVRLLTAFDSFKEKPPGVKAAATRGLSS